MGQMTDAIVFSSTTQLAATIRAGHVSATAVLEAHLAQIERHNPALNAIITLDAERAHERARAADGALACGEVWGLLHGVPFTLKDAHATAGMRTTVGFPPLADHAPAGDSTVAARLKEAGRILLGKTNVPTMLADYQTNNPLFGRTNNPWHPDRTPGGSSGGAAATLASGMTPFDIGTDLSGSIRIPAHFCGLCGLKPTEGRVSTAGLIPDPHGTPRTVRIMSTIGPLARTVNDLALLYPIIAGPDGCDTEVQPVPIDRVPKRELAHLRIAVAPTLPGIPVAAEIRDAVMALARQLDHAGAVVEEAALPALDFNQELASAGELIGMMVGAFDREGQGRPVDPRVGGVLPGVGRPALPGVDGDGIPPLRTGRAAERRWPGRGLLADQRPRHGLQLHRPSGDRAAPYARPRRAPNRGAARGETVGRVAPAGAGQGLDVGDQRFPTPPGY